MSLNHGLRTTDVMIVVFRFWVWYTPTSERRSFAATFTPLSGGAMKLSHMVWSALLVIAGIGAITGRAQTITDTVGGTVTDPKGAVVVGATVTVKSEET